MFRNRIDISSWLRSVSGHADDLGMTDHRERDEEDQLRRDAEHAGFDLGTDVGHPQLGHEAAGFDLDLDIGRDNEPPELRR